MSGKRTAAVKAMCLECQGWSDGAVDAVRKCTAIGCPLWAVRPFQKTKVGVEYGNRTVVSTVETAQATRDRRVAALVRARAAKGQKG